MVSTRPANTPSIVAVTRCWQIGAVCGVATRIVEWAANAPSDLRIVTHHASVNPGSAHKTPPGLIGDVDRVWASGAPPG
ncbi:MAG: hypothetical protein ACRDRA_14910 [Pseudonocardiaceae bacterium]